MEERVTAKHFTRRDEQRLLKIATDSLRSNFPNPERHGCPGSIALQTIARRQLEFPAADDIVDHIATCSPCFLEYGVHRRRYRLLLVGRAALCCVAALLLTALLLRFAPIGRPRHEIVAQLPPAAVKTVLDFQNRTVERSDRPQVPSEQPVPHLPRAVLNLIIKLPIGTEDGLYAVQLRTQAGQSVLDATGTAAWDGSAEVLAATADARKLDPGGYLLAIRSGTSAWREYRVVLD